MTKNFVQRDARTAPMATSSQDDPISAQPTDLWIARVGHWYGRVEPVFAIAIAVTYLGWAVTTASAFSH